MDQALRYRKSAWALLLDYLIWFLAISSAIYCLLRFESGAPMLYLLLSPVLTVFWVFARSFSQIDRLSKKSYREHLALTPLDPKEFLRANFTPVVHSAVKPFLIGFLSVGVICLIIIVTGLGFKYIGFEEFFYGVLVALTFTMKSLAQVVLSVLCATDIFYRECRSGKDSAPDFSSYLLAVLYAGISICAPWLDLLVIFPLADVSRSMWEGEILLILLFASSLSLLGFAFKLLSKRRGAVAKIYFEFD